MIKAANPKKRKSTVLVGIFEMSEILGVSVDWFHGMTIDGYFPFVQDGEILLFHPPTIIKLVESIAGPSMSQAMKCMEMPEAIQRALAIQRAGVDSD